MGIFSIFDKKKINEKDKMKLGNALKTVLDSETTDENIKQPVASNDQPISESDQSASDVNKDGVSLLGVSATNTPVPSIDNTTQSTMVNLSSSIVTPTPSTDDPLQTPVANLTGSVITPTQSNDDPASASEVNLKGSDVLQTDDVNHNATLQVGGVSQLIEAPTDKVDVVLTTSNDDISEKEMIESPKILPNVQKSELFIEPQTNSDKQNIDTTTQNQTHVQLQIPDNSVKSDHSSANLTEKNKSQDITKNGGDIKSTTSNKKESFFSKLFKKKQSNPISKRITDTANKQSTEKPDKKVTNKTDEKSLEKPDEKSSGNSDQISDIVTVAETPMLDIDSNSNNNKQIIDENSEVREGFKPDDLKNSSEKTNEIKLDSSENDNAGLVKSDELPSEQVAVINPEQKALSDVKDQIETEISNVPTKEEMKNETKQKKKKKGLGLFEKKRSSINVDKKDNPLISNINTGINLLPPATTAEIALNERKASFNIAGAVFILILVLLSIGIIGSNLVSKLENQGQKKILNRLEKEVAQDQDTLIKNAYILRRIKLFDSIQQNTVSYREVFEYWDQVSSKLGKINNIELDPDLHFVVRGEASSLTDVSKLWHLLSMDSRVNSVNLNSVGTYGSKTTFEFEGQLNYDYFKNKTNDNQTAVQ